MIGLALAIMAGQSLGSPALKGLDPVLLCRGQEVQGKTSIEADHAGIRYLFATESNRSRFLADPERWGIQMGGACARMGPLTGRGNTGRFWVYDGRVYVFASEACRDGFKKNPVGHVELPETRLHPTLEQAASAKTWLNRAAAWHGSDQVERVVWEFQTNYRETGGTFPYVVTYGFQAPDRLIKRESYKEWSGRYFAESGQAVYVEGADRKPVVGAERDYLVRMQLAQPLVALCLRRLPGFVAADAGDGRLPGVGAARLIDVWVSNVRARLYLDPQSAAVLGVSLRRRENGVYTPVTLRFRESEDILGVRVPVGYETAYGGPPYLRGVRRPDRVRVNAAADAALLAP